MEQNKMTICHSKIEAFKSIYAKSRELKRENEKQYKKFNYETKTKRRKRRIKTSFIL